MKKITLLLVLCFGFIFSINQLNAQCTSFSGGGPYTNFNTSFGGAPCDDGSGCPFNEISTFEMWADESYLMDNVVAGNTYTFSACNGPGAGSWPISYTIIAPSGAIDAFGLDGGSTCAITWTATESGTYQIGISEAGIPCDTSTTNRTTDNGFPAITCSTGSSCPTCTETEAPSPATNPTPAIFSTDILIDISNPGANPLITPFSWDDGVLGGSVESTNLTIGTNIAGDNIGTITGATNGNGITYSGWEYDTTYYWSVESINCFGSTTSPVWSFTTGSCTATTNPNAVTTPTPTNVMMNVPIDASDPSNLLITPFSWVPSATGDLADTFNISLGTNMAGDDIGTIYSATNGNGIVYAWEYDTTYYWSVEAVNCFGRTTSAVWSFTTEETLSIENTELNAFKVYPNPTSDILNIKSSLDIDNVTVTNLLGQNVMNFNNKEVENNSVNISSLQEGIYIITVSAGNKSETFRIIKQ